MMKNYKFILGAAAVALGAGAYIIKGSDGPFMNLFNAGPHQDPFENFLKKVYSDRTGEISPEEKTRITNEGGAPTYGEITYKSVRELIKTVNITDKDVFFDLGSGLGKMVFQIAHETKAESYGIELAKERFGHAISVLEHLKTSPFAQSVEKVKFLNQNILDADLSQATVIFMCSTCFSEELMEKIAKKLKNLPNLRFIISLKSFPKGFFTLDKQLALETSWNPKGSPIHIYKVR